MLVCVLCIATLHVHENMCVCVCSCLMQGLRLRAGIVGIERNIEKKQQQTGQQVSQAFKDLDALIDKASRYSTEKP